MPYNTEKNWCSIWGVGGGGGGGVAVKENNLSLKKFYIIRISSSDKNLGWKRDK